MSKLSHGAGSFRRAVARLPLALEQLTRKLGHALVEQVPQALKLWGRNIYLTDGATATTPDTPELVRRYGL